MGAVHLGVVELEGERMGERMKEPALAAIVPRDGTAGTRRKIFEDHGRLAGSNIF